MPILVGSFWLSLLSKEAWGETLKYSFSHQELLSSVAVYGFWNSHHYLSSVLPTIPAIWNNIFCTEGHRSDISEISSGRNKFTITQYFHFFCWLGNEPGTVFMPLYRGKVTEKTVCYHCILIWVKCQEYAVLTFIFLFISPWSNKACRQDILGLPCPSLKVNGHLIFSLLFVGTGVRQLFPQSCASVIFHIIVSVDSHWDGIRNDRRFWSFISLAAGIQDVDGFRNIIPDVWVPGSPLAYTCTNK